MHRPGAWMRFALSREREYILVDFHASFRRGCDTVDVCLTRIRRAGVSLTVRRQRPVIVHIERRLHASLNVTLHRYSLPTHHFYRDVD